MIDNQTPDAEALAEIIYRYDYTDDMSGTARDCERLARVIIAAGWVSPAVAKHDALGEALFFDRLEKARADVEHLTAQRDELISERDTAREEAVRQGAEVDRLTRVLEGP